MDASIRILSRIEPVNSILVAAWPGMGNVAYGAAVYLRENLKAEKFAEIKPEDIFYQTGIQIREGKVEIPDLPRSEFYFYKNQHMPHDLLIFIGESQPVMEKEYELAQRVIEVAHYFDVSEILTFAATPVNITHHTDPGVWGVSTSKEMLERFPGLGVKVMNSGHIGGLNGLLLGVGKDIGMKGTCLLGEIPFYTAKIENPKSSLAVLRTFMKFTGITLDLSGLKQMSKFVEEEIDRVSKTTKQTLFGEEPEKENIDQSEEAAEDKEAEGTPPEIRDRIEYLFELASGDVSKAGELKKELDKWGIFQEYEDRFLDLFGRNNL
jgi:proteasome assembly chaperone (PAC2) family protein